jgi:hypothetical protein
MFKPPIWLVGVVGLVFASIFLYYAVTAYPKNIGDSFAYGIMSIVASVATYSLISELRKENPNP